MCATACLGLRCRLHDRRCRDEQRAQSPHACAINVPARVHEVECSAASLRGGRCAELRPIVATTRETPSRRRARAARASNLQEVERRCPRCARRRAVRARWRCDVPSPPRKSVAKLDVRGAPCACSSSVRDHRRCRRPSTPGLIPATCRHWPGCPVSDLESSKRKTTVNGAPGAVSLSARSTWARRGAAAHGTGHDECPHAPNTPCRTGRRRARTFGRATA